MEPMNIYARFGVKKIKAQRQKTLLTFSGLMFKGHRWVDVPCMHPHPAARVGQGRALRLPVVVTRGHVAARRPAVHPVLVGGGVRTGWHVTGQGGRRLRAHR